MENSPRRGKNPAGAVNFIASASIVAMACVQPTSRSCASADVHLRMQSASHSSQLTRLASSRAGSSGSSPPAAR